MKKLILLVVVLFCTQNILAQAFHGDGDKKLNVGFVAYGFGTGVKGTYDIGVSDYISIGGGLELYLNEDNNTERNFYAHMRGNLHLSNFFELPWEIDVYPGADFGLTSDSFAFGIYVGARYFLSNNFGVFAELGNRGSIGVTLDF